MIAIILLTIEDRNVLNHTKINLSGGSLTYCNEYTGASVIQWAALMGAAPLPLAATRLCFLVVENQGEAVVKGGCCLMGAEFWVKVKRQLFKLVTAESSPYSYRP
jgi:hypothetical protein